MYTVNPKRLTVKAELEMEDGQVFNFVYTQTDFDDETSMEPFYEVSKEVYVQMDTFIEESEVDQEADDEDPIDFEDTEKDFTF